MPHTLRSFLESIDNRMLHIREPVDPVRQVGYLCSESRGPLMFHNLDGFPGWRLTDILIKDRKGQAAALGLDDVKEVCPFLAAQMSKGPGKSKMVKDGPVKEVKLIGKENSRRAAAEYGSLPKTATLHFTLNQDMGTLIQQSI